LFFKENTMDNKKIIIVDDDEEILELIEKKLKGLGYEVLALTRGGKIVEESRQFEPDLILMDIMLPDIDGAEAVKLLQEDRDTTGVPVIFLSGIVTAEDDAPQAEISVGDRHYAALGKPFTVKELLDAIEKAI